MVGEELIRHAPLCAQCGQEVGIDLHVSPRVGKDEIVRAPQCIENVPGNGGLVPLSSLTVLGGHIGRDCI